MTRKLTILDLVLVFFVTFPLAALAQAAADGGLTVKGFDLTPLIGGLIVLISGVIAWVGRKLAAAQSASAEKSRAETAALQAAEIALMLAGRAWDRLAPEVQRILADGQVTAAERAELEATVKALLEESRETVTSRETLERIASALGVPFAGLVARIASMVLDQFTKAHDPTMPEVSVKAYPVFTDAG